MYSIFYLIGLMSLLAVITYYYFKCRKLSIENTYFHAVMNNLPSFVYIKDLSGKIIMVNTALAKMMNCSKKDIEGKHSSELFLANYKDTVEEEDRIVISEQKSIYVERQIEIIKGNPHWYNTMKSPVYDKKHKLMGIFVRLQNIDKEKLIEENKDEFVATLTHDLKSPATAQLNAINLLLNGTFGKLNDSQTEMIELLRCSNQYMSQLIATIMDTYIYDNGKIKLSLQEFDLNELMQKVTLGMINTFTDRKQTAKIINKLSDNFITADRLQLKRVIMNLLSNAAIYGLNNSVIIIEMISQNDTLEFNVINESKLSPSENLENIFEKYKTLKNSKYNKISTGLGLYLSKQIVELHNGKIYAKMLPDNKCMVGFKIPIKIPVK